MGSARAYALALVAAAFLPIGLGDARAAEARKPFRERLGFQLYSSRNFPPLEEQLRTISALGYKAVEFHVPGVAEPSRLKLLLDTYGLESPSGHFDLDGLRADLPGNVARARLLGIRTIVVPYLAPERRPEDADGWLALGWELEEIARRLSREGLQLAWHNHEFELQRLPDGSFPLDRLLAAAPRLRWQADVGWIARAGEDPTYWLQRHRARILTAHLKDLAADAENGEGGWADLGHGVLDWAKIAPLLQDARLGTLYVEHDAPADYRRFARRSLECLSAWPTEPVADPIGRSRQVARWPSEQCPGDAQGARSREPR